MTDEVIIMEQTHNPMSKKHETGEEHLAALIRQAGDEARAQNKKVMELHYRKLEAAVAEGVARSQKHASS